MYNFIVLNIVINFKNPNVTLGFDKANYITKK